MVDPVYFNRLYTTNDPFVFESQVHQFFYVKDQTKTNVYYARKKVPFDLYDLEEENYPFIGGTFLREPTKGIGLSNISFVLTLDGREMIYILVLFICHLIQNS